MTEIELLNIILYLVPSANCVVTNINNENNVNDGSCSIYQLSGLLVAWNINNTETCPTQDQIANADPALVEQSRILRLKAQRDTSMASDPIVKIGFQIAQSQNSSLTLDQYLDSIAPIA